MEPKEVQKFLEKLVKLDPLSVIGVFKLLGVELDPENPAIEDRIGDLIDAFCASNRKKRRELFRLIDKSATKRLASPKRKEENLDGKEEN